MTISVIIPTYNEADFIPRLINYLKQHADERLLEIIITDAGSVDDTIRISQELGATAVTAPRKGRAAQMNYGATIAKGEILYFIHADSFPPPAFMDDIALAIKDGYSFGRYRTKFDSNNILLKINAWFTRFDFFMCRGGDQTLFITQKLFTACTGFNEEMKIMEEFEFCTRAKKNGRYKIFNKAALISARKYDQNSWLQVQRANAAIVRMFKKGDSQEAMLARYKKMLSYRKNSF
ncbi:MAG: TIGR04283 family arsenosugar biosynthesis glycosyltransferase [Ferruginibacter sp.]